LFLVIYTNFNFLLNILFILPEYYPHSGGGISTYYLHYLNALMPACKRIKVIVGSGYTQATDKFLHNGIEVEYLEPSLYEKYVSKFARLNLSPGYRNNISAAWAMWDQAAQGDGFDIVECTDFGLGFIPWVIEHSKPVITRLHGSTGQIALHENSYQDIATDSFMQAELSLLPMCDGLITHSMANRSFWLKMLPGSNVHYLLPIYEGQQSEPLPLNQRDHLGLVTARLQKWKGPVELCKALQNLKQPVKVKWIGRDMPYLNKQTTGNYLCENYAQVWDNIMCYETSKPHAEISSLQRKALFGIVPSVWDMFNFTALEFLASGTPLICSDGAGAVDIIEQGTNGFKYQANDVHALAQCIELVSKLSSEDYNKIIQAGLNTLKSLLSGEALIPANLKLYEDLVKDFRPKVINSFLSKLYVPSDEIITLETMLDEQPLKKLVKYIYRRSLAKLLRK
jgi:glycosyltransferase involved in cell wall biosynthesis